MRLIGCFLWRQKNCAQSEFLFLGLLRSVVLQALNTLSTFFRVSLTVICKQDLLSIFVIEAWATQETRYSFFFLCRCVFGKQDGFPVTTLVRTTRYRSRCLECSPPSHSDWWHAFGWATTQPNNRLFLASVIVVFFDYAIFVGVTIQLSLAISLLTDRPDSVSSVRRSYTIYVDKDCITAH